MAKADLYFFRSGWLIIIFTGIAQFAYSQHEQVQKQADSLFALSRALRHDPDSAEVLIRKALVLSKEDGYKHGEAVAYSGIGKVKYYAARYDSGIWYLDKALSLYEKLGERENQCKTLNNIGAVATDKGDLEMAMNAFTRALAIAYEISLDVEIQKIQCNIGRVYMERTYLGEPVHQKALDHFQVSYDLARTDIEKANTSSNMGIAYKEMGNAGMALKMFEESLAHSRAAGDEFGSTHTLGLISSHYLDVGAYDKALDYTLQELSMRKKYRLEDQYLVHTYSRLGNIFREMTRFDSAVTYQTKALKLARELNLPVLFNIYEYLAQAHQAAERYDSALHYYIKYATVKDSLIAAENEQQIDDLMVKYEAASKDREIALLQKTQWLQVLIIICIVMILVVAIVLIVVYKQKVYQQKQLAIATKEINEQKMADLLREHEMKEIRAVVLGQEKERKRIAGELHDSVAGTLAGIKQHIVFFARSFGFRDELQDLIRITDDVYNEVRELSHHLMPPKIEASFFTQLLINYLNNLASNHHLDVRHVFYPEGEINDLPNEVKVALYRIVQELTTNVARHACADRVEVQMTKSHDAINLIVEDNGKGFDPGRIKEGIGLHNIKSRVKALHGTIDIDSSPKRGTIIIVDIRTSEPVMEAERL